jgi:ParB-like chromosome segregation protein Spo0J
MEIELSEIDLKHADLRIHDDSDRRRLAASLAEIGQRVPIVVIASGPRFLLIDGYLRVDVLRRLSRDTAQATTWPLGETEALIQRHHLSARSRSIVEEGWLLQHLAREERLGLDELAARFCRSKSWVSRRIDLVEKLGASIHAKLRAGIFAPQAAMKYLVPLARANRAHLDRLLAALGPTRLSVRDVGALYEGWRRADAAGRERLVDDPHLFLRAIRTAEPDADEDAGALLGKDLAALAGIAWRATGRIHAGVRAPTRRWQAAEAAFGALRDAIEKEGPHARSVDSNHHSQTP